MAVISPGFTVPLGNVRDAQGKPQSLYISPQWQIFFQGLFERTGGSETDRFDALEEADWLHVSLIDDALGRADGAVRSGRVHAADIATNVTNIATNTADIATNVTAIAANTARLKEIEFLGAFSWA